MSASHGYPDGILASAVAAFTWEKLGWNLNQKNYLFKISDAFCLLAKRNSSRTVLISRVLFVVLGRALFVLFSCFLLSPSPTTFLQILVPLKTRDTGGFGYHYRAVQRTSASTFAPLIIYTTTCNFPFAHSSKSSSLYNNYILSWRTFCSSLFMYITFYFCIFFL